MARHFESGSIKQSRTGAHELLAARLGPFKSRSIGLGLLASFAGTIAFAQTITNINPPSNLLAPGSTSVALTFNTSTATICAYSVGTSLPYGSMQSFDSGQPTTSHSGTVLGLSADPSVVNNVYIRCASNPNDEAALLYRSVAAPNGTFPRIGTIWWGPKWMHDDPAHARKLQLYLAAGGDSVAALGFRAVNPGVIMLPNVNATSTTSGGPFGLVASIVPDDYFLKDVNGNRIAIFPGDPCTCLLNLTKPEVAEFIANFAYQKLVQSGLAFDGVFFDNFSTSISQQKIDINGRPLLIDADGDGRPDDPAVLDAAWQKGVYHLIETFRKLVPYGYVSGHLNQIPPEARSLASFNGDSLIAQAALVREGAFPFVNLFQAYQQWIAQGVQPPITTIQSQPPIQIAYGYGIDPLQAMPTATAEFARTYYPNMRFALGLALMNNGFFVHDFGDNGSAVSWWYDEYDFDLGFPLGAASLINPPGASANLLQNGSFENGAEGWQLYVVPDGQANASLAIQNSTVADGASAATVRVNMPGSVDWHIFLEHASIPLSAGEYTVQFWARADAPRTIAVVEKGGPPSYVDYSHAQVGVDSAWRHFSYAFKAPTDTTDAHLQFWFGEAGDFVLDGIEVTAAPAQLYRRDFTKGVVLLNGTSTPQTLQLEPGLRRFQGTQAPRHQYIIDDSDPRFTAVGPWSTIPLDSGSIFGVTPVLKPPFFHAWNGSLHQLDSAAGTAQWDLAIPVDDQYTILAWLPAAPSAGSWTRNAIYEIVSGGNVLSTYTLDQSTATAGDQWHTIATVQLKAADALTLRVRNGGSGTLIADAVYVTSSALYNDGTAANQVTLGAFDGILLKRDSAITELRDVVEYYNASLDHYFITWVADEQANLDAGNTPTRWSRTGYSFKTHTAPQTGTSPVCRYYIPPTKGDSHFFGRGTAECDATGQKNPTFVLEDPDFMNMFLPIAGTCPAGTMNVYRAFDNRFDANHRYMTDKAVRDQMVAKGWIAEGDGPNLVVMCAPQ